MTALIIVVGILAVVGAVGVVLSTQPLYSALSLVFSIGMLAILYLILNAQLLFAVQLIVYAGAVMVLFVFIIALLNPKAEDRPILDVRAVVAFVAVITITAALFATAHNGITYSGSNFRGAVVGASHNDQDPAYTKHAFDFKPADVNSGQAGNVQTVGGQLFTVFLLPFEITSLLLLVAAIGAVYLTRRVPKTEVDT